MTLHQAIEKLLQQQGRPMTAREIADELNQQKWYVKGDKSEIQGSQIFARVNRHHELYDIDRSISPFQIKLLDRQLETKSKHLKTSFEPISNLDTTVLILGTLPGDKSLELGEYYGHSRNRFWKIISTITNNDLPLTYSKKKELLIKSKIGVWDIVHKANRKGSLDNAIMGEVPNDLDDFIERHKKLKVIGFNGIKSQALFDKYFERKSGIKYITLPSTSPANIGINFDNICKVWRQILIHN